MLHSFTESSLMLECQPHVEIFKPTVLGPSPSMFTTNNTATHTESQYHHIGQLYPISTRYYPITSLRAAAEVKPVYMLQTVFTQYRLCLDKKLQRPLLKMLDGEGYGLRGL